MKSVTAMLLLLFCTAAHAGQPLPNVSLAPRLFLDPFYPSPYAGQGWNQGGHCQMAGNAPNGDLIGTCRYSGTKDSATRMSGGIRMTADPFPL